MLREQPDSGMLRIGIDAKNKQILQQECLSALCHST